MTQLIYCHRALRQLRSLYTAALVTRDFEGMRVIGERIDTLRAVMRALECVRV